MDIPFAPRSRFLPTCIENVSSQRSLLDEGSPILIVMGTGGYGGTITVTIDPTRPNDFATDWENNDPTRFPARIKAAATALRDCRCFGRFTVEHHDGALSIRRIDS